MAKHKDFTIATDVKVYLCDPQSPWQRGANENMNLLLLQYFPRGTFHLSRPQKTKLLRVNSKQVLRRPSELAALTGEIPSWYGKLDDQLPGPK